VRTAALVAVALAGLAAGPAAAAPAKVTTSLTVTVWPQGKDGPSSTWSLRCLPARGTHPQRAQACAKLAATAAPFAAVPDKLMCTQQYGGPEEAVVRGLHKGKRVLARFHRRDGCHIARWNRLVPLLPPPNA
jgi:hypothetical protein